MLLSFSWAHVLVCLCGVCIPSQCVLRWACYPGPASGSTGAAADSRCGRGGRSGSHAFARFCHPITRRCGGTGSQASARGRGFRGTRDRGPGGSTGHPWARGRESGELAAVPLEAAVAVSQRPHQWVPVACDACGASHVGEYKYDPRTRQRQAAASASLE